MTMEDDIKPASAASETNSGDAAPPTAERSPFQRVLTVTVGPIVAAFVLSAIILMLVGVNPLTYYGYILERSLFSSLGLQQTATRMAPLLFLSASLIIAFRAGIWNLGTDGQFLLGAVISAATAPLLVGVLPGWMLLLVGFVLAALVGAVWSVIPALLKAYQGVNEIITTLMMSFLGVLLASTLVKLLFRDPATTVPQTRTLPVEDRLPRLFDTSISSGLIWGLVAVLLVHFMMTRTAFGLRLRMVGANPAAAAHAGLSVPLLTMATFGLSAGFAGLAGASEILGVAGNVRANWDPAYGLMVIPLVFLARFHGVGAIVLVFFYSALMIGSESAARRLGVPQDFTLVLVASLLICLGLGEFIDQRKRRKER
ncbi:putative B6 ABC transporter permease subunit 2 [Hoeflea sp.]|uniref:putative B6 ABC transporter permease subunit 2 n=1 Tax=Hoeflea sp. TaxID=1940281 RepID=UPI003B52DECC